MTKKLNLSYERSIIPIMLCFFLLFLKWRLFTILSFLSICSYVCSPSFWNSGILFATPFFLNFLSKPVSYFSVVWLRASSFTFSIITRWSSIPPEYILKKWRICSIFFIIRRERIRGKSRIWIKEEAFILSTKWGGWIESEKLCAPLGE